MTKTTHQKRNTLTAETNRAIFTPKELAGHLGISEAMVYRLLKDGEIPRRRAGKKYIIPRSAVEDWLRNSPATRSRRAS